MSKPMLSKGEKSFLTPSVFSYPALQALTLKFELKHAEVRKKQWKRNSLSSLAGVLSSIKIHFSPFLFPHHLSSVGGLFRYSNDHHQRPLQYSPASHPSSFIPYLLLPFSTCVVGDDQDCMMNTDRCTGDST